MLDLIRPPFGRARLLVAAAVLLLTLPGEMGEVFKVIALGRAYEAPLSGLSMRLLDL